MVIFGGCSQSETHGDTWRLTIVDSHACWIQLLADDEGPGPRHSHAAAFLGSYIYVHGGCRGDGTILEDLWALDLGRLQWTCISTAAHEAPLRLFSQSLTAVTDHTLLLLGGCPERNAGVFTGPS
jgi:hypothetical protein